MKRNGKRTRLGVLSDEFFNVRLGGYGGFGWATRMLGQWFSSHPEHGIDLVFFSNQFRSQNGADETHVHNTRLVLRGRNRVQDWRNLWREQLDLLLLVDYNLGYRFHCAALARTPVVLWSRDPRTPEDWEIIRTLQIPGQENVPPQGIVPNDCASVAALAHFSRWARRPFLFATPAPGFAEKMRGTFGVETGLHFLPNIIHPPPGAPSKSDRPRVVFLGRLDPIKRPWLAVEIARRFPEVEFLLLGNAHYRGAGGWEPNDLPPNVQSLGHADEEQKWRALASAWILVNTSNHDGLAVSFLEALACETPIVSCVNPAGIVERYGIFVGEWPGTGLEGVPAFAAALEKLLRDDAFRQRLGGAGRAWVNATHTEARFLESFSDLCQRAGVARP